MAGKKVTRNGGKGKVARHGGKKASNPQKQQATLNLNVLEP
jgi:hypothetical protein